MARGFNSHQTECGYCTKDKTGEKVSNWANQNKFYFLHNAQDKVTFFSDQRQKECEPDLVFVAGQEDKTDMQARPKVLNDFPNSQNRPIIITIKLKIAVTIPLPKSR